MKRQKLSLLASLAAAFTAVVWSVPASAADIVFSNFGPGNTYQGNIGYTLGNGIEQAMAFTPSSNFTLAQIDVGIGIVPLSGINSVMLSLEGASGGLPDGTIESWTLIDLPEFGSTSNTVQTVNPAKPVSLVSGTEYWLVASASNFEGAWNLNSSGSTGPVAIKRGSSGWFLSGSALTQGAFAVQGHPVGVGVPEPATLGLMVLGLLGAGFSARRVRWPQKIS